MTTKNCWLAVFVFFLLSCSHSPALKKTEITDINGIKSDSVQKPVSNSLNTGAKVNIKTDGVYEFESEAYGVSTRYERMVDAERRAEEEALSKAVKESGVNVYSGFQNVMAESGSSAYQFLGKYINVWSSSLVSYEKVSEPVCSFDGTVNRCLVKIKGKIYFKGSPDPAFELKAALDKPAYFAGDEINLNFTANKDAYVTVLSCDEDGNVSVIFPNNYAGNRLSKAGESVAIPENMGFKLKAYLPEGRTQAIEMIHVIAVKSQPLIPESTLKEKREGGFISYPLGGIKELAARLAKFERSDWTSQVIIYEIRSKE